MSTVLHQKILDAGLQDELLGHWKNLLESFEDQFLDDFQDATDEGAGGGLDIVDSIAEDMDELALDDNKLTSYVTPPGQDSVRASFEFITNFEVGQAEDLEQAKAPPAVPPFPKEYA